MTAVAEESADFVIMNLFLSLLPSEKQRTIRSSSQLIPGAIVSILEI